MVQVKPVLRLNMSGCGIGPDKALEADRYQAALDMAEYADNHGFAIVNVEEHHDVDCGWMGSPLTMAAAIAARTKHVQIRGSAVLVTLYDPVRLAEDMALLDVISRGRFVLCAGQGYRPSEYHMMDRDFAARGATMDFVIETLLKARREGRVEAEYERLLHALHRCGPEVARATLGIATRPYAGAWLAAALVDPARPWTARHDTRLALIREGLAAIEKLGSRPL